MDNKLGTFKLIKEQIDNQENDLIVNIAREIKDVIKKTWEMYYEWEHVLEREAEEDEKVEVDFPFANCHLKIHNVTSVITGFSENDFSAIFKTQTTTDSPGCVIMTPIEQINDFNVYIIILQYVYNEYTRYKDYIFDLLVDKVDPDGVRNHARKPWENKDD